MGTDYGTGAAITEHDLTLAIPGEIGIVRQRLVEAVQKLGYKVVGEQPLHAKRRAKGACSSFSLNVLDYNTTLTISLKQTNNVAVLAAFNYEIESYMNMTKGDRQTLLREAEAIVALTTERMAASTCRACGTQVTDESHFCRRCGAPMVLDLPELEILRLTKATRGSYQNIFVGLCSVFLALLTTLPLFIVNGGRIMWPMLWVGIPFASYGLFLLIQATWQLHRTLNPKPAKTTSLNAAQPAYIAAPPVVTTALPPARPVASITEATTDLLSTSDRRVAEPVRRKDPNTAELDTDRLM
jgi:zinc-ribbon domain